MHLHSTDFYWQLVKPVILLLPLILVTCCQMCQFAGPRSAGSLTLPQPRLHVSFSKQHNGWSHRRDSTSSSYLLTPVNSVHCSRLWILSVSENHADSEMTERRKCVCKKHYCAVYSDGNLKLMLCKHAFTNTSKAVVWPDNKRQKYHNKNDEFWMIINNKCYFSWTGYSNRRSNTV